MRKRIYARHPWPLKIKYQELLLVKRLEKDYDEQYLKKFKENTYK